MELYTFYAATQGDGVCTNTLNERIVRLLRAPEHYRFTQSQMLEETAIAECDRMQILNPMRIQIETYWIYPNDIQDDRMLVLTRKCS
jgi:hypothetical protein